MALPSHLTLGVGGLVQLGLRSVPAAVTYEVRKGDGTVIQSETDANVSISAINTQLNCALSRHDAEMNVLSNVGLSHGVTVHLMDALEQVLVDSVSGEAVTLQRPVLKDHANLAYVQGCAVNVALGANVANSLWWDGHVRANVDGVYHYLPVECTRYPMHRMSTEQDLFDVEPLLADVLNAEEEPQRLLDAAHEHVLMQLGKVAPDRRVRVFVGSVTFKTCTALAALYLHYRRRGTDEGQLLADRYHKDFADALASVAGTTPRDADQDRVVEPDEAMSLRSGRLVH